VRALLHEQTRRLEADSGRRARNDADALPQAEIHEAASVHAVTTILLARHAESDWNVENRFQGHADRPLTERGREQAERLADELSESRLEAVYTSPLRRAHETAAIVAAPHGLEPVIVAELQEIDVGGWSGLSRAEVESRFPDAFRRWLGGGEGWEDGESYTEMAARVLAAVRRIAAEHAGGRVLVVSHGGPIRAVQAAAADTDVHTYRRLHRVERNARVSAVAVEDGRITPIH
jgi:broad specificity phosphatase PhoE